MKVLKGRKWEIKKILLLLLALCMAIGLMPMTGLPTYADGNGTKLTLPDGQSLKAAPKGEANPQSP